jgi:hypothetical protein
MKYLKTHPIHEDYNPMTNPYQNFDDADSSEDHEDADDYAGAGEQPKKSNEEELSDDTLMNEHPANIAGQNGVSGDEEQVLSDDGEENTNVKTIAGQNGSAVTDDEQKLSEIAESRIIRFTYFN